MPINAVSTPAHPECEGDQWSVTDIDQLAELVAHVLVGRAWHAALILQGVRLVEGPITINLKERLRPELHPTSAPQIYHRDGLLFEIICWVAAKLSAGADEALTDPHLKATNQGADCIKVRVDPATGMLSRATVYEYKCTTNPRAMFNGDVMEAFRQYASGERDNQLSQAAIALLERLGLSGPQLSAAYDRLIQARPLAYRASLTVSPLGYSSAQRLGLFAGFEGIGGAVADRAGDTFPLDNIRDWFRDFSALVWAKIEAFDV